MLRVAPEVNPSPSPLGEREGTVATRPWKGEGGEKRFAQANAKVRWTFASFERPKRKRRATRTAQRKGRINNPAFQFLSSLPGSTRQSRRRDTVAPSPFTRLFLLAETPNQQKQRCHPGARPRDPTHLAAPPDSRVPPNTVIASKAKQSRNRPRAHPKSRAFIRSMMNCHAAKRGSNCRTASNPRRTSR